MIAPTMNVLSAVLCVVFVTVVNGGGQPPSIIDPQGNKWPNPLVYVRTSNPKEFKCSASASPPAKYYWTVNGTAVNTDGRILSVNESSGTMTTGFLFSQLHSGDYQCFAYNSHGTAMTPILQIQPTVASTFKGQTVSTEDMDVPVSNYLLMECRDVPISVPQWQFSWVRGKMKDGRLESENLNLGKRMVIDKEGNLHFLWTEQADHGFIYACSTKNEVMLVLVQNTQTIRLSVTKAMVNDRPPELKYIQDIQVHAGQTAKLMCIFTYYSSRGEPLNIKWYLRGHQVVDNNNKPVMGETLTLYKVHIPLDQADGNNPEGEYMCEASLGDNPPTARGKVKLTIVAPPSFVKGEEPKTQSVPVDKDAVFQCKTTSHNTYSLPPVWLIDTVPLMGCPKRYFECTAPQPNGYSQCIAEKNICDNLPDCTDDSDEHNCPGLCSESQQRCNGKCIPGTVPCNELICNYPGFMCHDKKSCLTKDKICNGANDCSDGSDENACHGRDVIVRSRFHINSQRTELTLPRVQLTDSMCIQCMVSNHYGTAIGNGCITVIDKILVLEQPNSTYYVQPGTTLNIPVIATTDRNWQNQMKYIWQWYVEQTDKNTKLTKLVVEKLPPKGKLGEHFKLSQNGRHMQIVFPEVIDDDADAYNTYDSLKDRVYSVVIYHKYDRVELNFTVTGEDVITPKVIPIAEVPSNNLWFIALILAILLLFIVIALIVCYLHRNRGGTYPLDKKEHQAGHDPAQELKDSGFHDVGRVGDYDDDKPGSDNASLSEDVKPWDSDDPTDDYDFDVSKFNEDGSFIGLYVDKKSKYAKEVTV